MTHLRKKDIQRSENYRANFIRENPGIHALGKYWYICSYCGRLVTREKMQVDHVVSIDLARRKRLYRLLAPPLEKGGINGLGNLCSSCPKCNNRKSNSGGWWILKGYVGHVYYTFEWIVVIAVLVICLMFVFFGIITPENIRHFISNSISRTAIFLVSCLLQVIHEFVFSFFT